MDTISFKDPAILTATLNDWLDQAEEGDYIAIQAYLQPSPIINEALQKIRFNGQSIPIGTGLVDLYMSTPYRVKNK